MLVECILPRARERLSTIETGTPVRNAARLMARPHIDLLVVCEGGTMAGVVTKTDIVAHVSRSLDAGLEDPIGTVMTRAVVYFRPTDPLVDVWRIMKERGLQHVPIVVGACNPIGVAYSRDVLEGLLTEAKVEDERLRDYISDFGYR